MNLSIPDAAAELSVSETRLRRTLLETAAPTLSEFRQTRTGVRKTTVLSPDAIAMLRTHFQASLVCRASEQAPAVLPEPTKLPIDYRENTSDSWAQSADDSFRTREYDSADVSEVCVDGSLARPGGGLDESAERPGLPAAVTQSVPVAQFNALLYQHNVLREELGRVSEYLDGCDRLLGEMVKTIATLEERTRRMEPVRVSHAGLSGVLRSVTTGVQNTLFGRRAPAQPLMRPAEVYYANVLAGR